MRAKLLITTIFLLLVLGNAMADNKMPPAPLDQWDPQTALWMSRAWIAEAGWGDTEIRKQEQHAIGHALVTRWQQIVAKQPSIRLVTVVRNYCSGLGYMRKAQPTKRQLWVRNLFDEVQPEGWPQSYASWRNHLPMWKDTVARVRKFAHGELPNPCPGACHFGGLRAGDLPQGKMERHECSALFEQQKPQGTTFYFIATSTTIARTQL